MLGFVRKRELKGLTREVERLGADQRAIWSALKLIFKQIDCSQLPKKAVSILSEWGIITPLPRKKSEQGAGKNMEKKCV